MARDEGAGQRGGGDLNEKIKHQTTDDTEEEETRIKVETGSEGGEINGPTTAEVISMFVGTGAAKKKKIK